MNESDGSQDQLDVQNLYLQAIDAYADGRYGDVENKLNGIIKPPQLEVLLQQVKEYYWLATAQRMQGKYNEAIGTYEKLIELAKDQSLNATIVLKQLQSIKEQLGQLTTTLYQFSSAFPASNQQSTVQATQSEKATNLSTITGG